MRADGPPVQTRTRRAPWAARLEAVRMLTGQDKGQFAKDLGLEAETYRRYERGETQPNIDTLLRIREETGVSLDALLAGKAPAFSRASAVALDLERQIAAILSILDDEQIPRPEWPQKIAASVVDVLVRAGSEQPTGRIPAPKSQAGNFSRPSPCANPKAVNHALAIRAPSHMRKLFPTFCC